MDGAAETLLRRLAGPKVLVLDGAMGTELKRRGIPTPLPAWSSHALRIDPEAVLAIHLDHVRAGADLITANTFRTTRRALAKAGAGNDAAHLTSLAVRLARKAASDTPPPRCQVLDAVSGIPASGFSRPVHVLGSLAPLEDCYSPDLVPDAGTLAREHAEHAARLAEAGVDAILVETMNTRREAVAAVRAARATGLPVLASFVASSRGQLFDGEPLASLVPALLDAGIVALLVNCTPVATTGRVVPELRRLAGSTPIGAYANIGFPHPDEGWEFAEGTPPAAYARHAAAWIQEGARIVGGCCGTTPEHIAAVRALVDASVSSSPRATSRRSAAGDEPS